MNKSFILAATSLAGSFSVGLPAAIAQPIDGEQQNSIQDIVVTARRVEEALQTTPVAVTALSARALERGQITTLADVQQAAPSLVIMRGTGSTSGFASVAIRGQGALAPIISNDPAVATYVDGVYFGRVAQGVTDLNDIERFEVLRGPQGTLFGRNTTGGALNIITKDPTDRLEGELNGKAGNFAYKEAGIVLNVPIATGLAARLVYNFKEHDGYGKNQTLGNSAGDQKSHFVRGKLRYERDGFDVTLSGDYNKLSGSIAQLSQLSAINPAIVPATSPFFPAATAALHTKANWYSTYSGGTSRIAPGSANAALLALMPADVQALYGALPFYDLKAYGFGGVVNIEVGDFSVKSITAYRYTDTNALNDTDTTAAPILATFGGLKAKAYSEEIQISGDITDSLRFITGGYWSRETGSEYSRSQIFGGLLRNSIAGAKNITKGLYAQVYYDVSPTLRAVGGFRYTWDTRDTALHNQQVLGLPADYPGLSPTGFNCNNNNIIPGAPGAAALAAACDQQQHKKFSYPAWTAGIDWRPSDGVLLYAKTSAAAKAGGWNTRAGALPAFKPEKVKDVEGGLKATWLDNRLRTNFALFHSWKTDNQAIVNAVVPGIGLTSFTQNNGDVRIWGGEFEGVAVPWRGMEISASLSLLDGKYKPGSFSEIQIVNGVPITVDLSGLPIPQLPKRQINIGATQTFPTADGEWAIHADYAYVSSQHFNAVKPADQQPQATKDAFAIENAYNLFPGYGLFNGRISYHINSPNIEMSIFGRNLAGKKYLARRFGDLYRQIGFAIENVGDPRTWGIGLKWKFGSN
ncbi:MAG: TonB-dependent receptor [Rhizorhabdus sp.]|nr:TonB-dependent receptor [Rhizorhabdus sp.]